MRRKLEDAAMMKFKFVAHSIEKGAMEAGGTKLLKKGFLGFSSNRFGRALSLAETFVKHGFMIKKFFSEQADEHQDRLFLACYAFLQSDSFNLCCDLGAS